MISYCPILGAIIDRVATLNPCSLARPWRLIFYVDEASPGNLLSVDNTRKVHAFYWSIAEFGRELLSKEHLWFLGGVIRSNIASEIAGGLSCIFKSLLKTSFFGVFNISAGVYLKLAPTVGRMLVAELGIVISDESALKSLWVSKGAAGMKPCFLCKNIVSIHSDLERLAAGGYIQSIKCKDFSKFDLHTNETVFEAVDRLARSKDTMRVGEFQAEERILGLNFHPEHILNDAELRRYIRPATVFMYDFVHVFLSGGLCNIEIFLFLRALKTACGFGYQQLRAFVQPWHWPKYLKASPADIFNDRREDSSARAQTFKAGASEQLTIYQVIRHIVETVVLPTAALASESASILALFKICDALVLLGRDVVSPDDFYRAVREHYVAFEVAYSDSNAKPKNHFAMHLGDQMRKHGTLFNCFVHERKHKTLKKFGTLASNTSAFEETLSLSLLNAHVEALQDSETLRTGTWLSKPLEDDGCLLHELRPHYVDVRRIFVAKACRHNMLSLSADDVVLLQDGRMAKCLFFMHLLPRDEHVAVLQMFTQRRRISATSNMFRLAADTCMVSVRSIVDLAVWAPDDGNDVIILTPPSLAWQR